MSNPRLSIHMMARDVAPEVARALRSVKTEIATELVLVDTGSTDFTPERAREICIELGFGFELVQVSPASHPELYFPDVAYSYQRKIPFPCTGKILLGDWSVPRNLGLDRCRGEYVLKLDADDVCLLPSEIPKILGRFSSPAAIFARTPYEVMNPVTGRRDYVTSYTRFWRNLPEIRFREVCHENVDWHPGKKILWNWPPILPVFRDLRDGPRVPGRNYKVLLREYERSTKRLDNPHLLIYLADEACLEDPWLALDCVLLLGQYDLLPTDRAWAQTIAGLAHEKLGHTLEAIAMYEKASFWWTRARFLLESLWQRKGECFANGADLAELAKRNREGFYPESASETEIVERLG